MKVDGFLHEFKLEGFIINMMNTSFDLQSVQNSRRSNLRKCLGYNSEIREGIFKHTIREIDYEEILNNPLYEFDENNC